MKKKKTKINTSKEPENNEQEFTLTWKDLVNFKET